MFFREKPKKLVIDGISDYKYQLEKVIVRLELKIQLSQDQCACEFKFAKGFLCPVDLRGSILRSMESKESRESEPMRTREDFTNDMYQDERNKIWCVISNHHPTYRFQLVDINQSVKKIFSEVIKKIRDESLGYNPPFDIVTRFDIHADAFGALKNVSVHSAKIKDVFLFLDTIKNALRSVKVNDSRMVLDLIDNAEENMKTPYQSRCCSIS